MAFYDDDDYYDDDDDLDNDDEEIGFDRKSAINPFASGGSGLPGRNRVSGGSSLRDSLASRLSPTSDGDDESGRDRPKSPTDGGATGGRFSGGGASSRSGTHSFGSRNDDKSSSGSNSPFSSRSRNTGAGPRVSGPIGGRRATDNDDEEDEDSGDSAFGSRRSPGNASSRLGVRPFGAKDNEEKEADSDKSSSRFGGGRPRFGSRDNDDNDKDSSRFGGGRKDEDDDKGSGRSSFGSRSDKRPSLGSQGFQGDDKKLVAKKGKKDVGKSGGLGGRFGQGKKDGDAIKKPAAEKDNKDAGKSGGLGGRFGRGKKDGDATKKPAAEKDNKDAGKSGGLGGRFGRGKKDGDATKKPAAEKGSGSSSGAVAALGGAAAGLAGRFGRGEGKKDDAKQPAAKSAPSRGGKGLNAGRFGGFGRGKKDDQSGSKSNKNVKKEAAGGGRAKQSAFGRDKAAGKTPSTKKGEVAASKDAATTSGILGGLTARLPFGGRAEKKPPKISKTRKAASKAPQVKEGAGLTLDAKLDILGVSLVFGALVLFLSSLSGQQGVVTGLINGLFTEILGWGAFGVPLTMAAIGLWLIVRHFGENAPEIDPVKIGGVIMLYIGGLMAFTFIETFHPLYSVATQEEFYLFVEHSIANGRGGGLVGGEIYSALLVNFGEISAIVFMIGWMVVALMLTTGTSAAELAIFVISIWRSFQISMRHRAQRRRALRLEAEQRRQEEATRIRVQTPTPVEIGAGSASGALPAPTSGSGVLPIEERAIPIRMGGQMISADNQEQQPAAMMPRASNGRGGGFASRLRGALPSRSKQPETPAVAVQPEEPIVATQNVGAAATTFGALLGNNNETPTVEPIASSPFMPKSPATTTGGSSLSDPHTTQPIASVAAPQTTEDFGARFDEGTKPTDDAAEAEKEEGKPEETVSSPISDRLNRLNAIRSGDAIPFGDDDKAIAPEDRAPHMEAVDPFGGVTKVPSPSPFRKPDDTRTDPEKPLEVIVQAAASVTEDAEPLINPAQQAKPMTVAEAPPPKRSATNPSYNLPNIRTLLSSGSEQDFDRESLVKRARTIEETLQSFGAPGRVVEINTGPVITQFGVEPSYLTARGGKQNRVKVSAIAHLDKDLQLALGAKSIRIEAPVPGKGYVGIEVPNEQASLVSLRDVMESDEFQKIDSSLAIALGQGVDGTPVAADLTSMPHLLVAGTTGAGKSVLVNAIISSLIVRNTPENVRFIMIDPKRVELTGYNGIPHLVAPVVVELERIVGVLKWVTREMDERYKKFSNAAARNIVDYNEHRDAGTEKMPYIVVIIDELADLMMLAPDETERVITRIAALARATGIHLVIATQRPSVDVVTGLIKANFPARVAFAVAGSVDSRVILDQPGAERLLGRGDMLYMSAESPAPLRLQGVFVSDMEIQNITRFWKAQAPMDKGQSSLTSMSFDDSPISRSAMPRGERFNTPPPPSTQKAFWDDDAKADDDGSEHEDELYEEAIELIRRLNKASVSLLQRRLRIGYTRAARMIDTMEAEGIVGPPTEGSKPRAVLPPKGG